MPPRAKRPEIVVGDRVIFRTRAFRTRLAKYSGQEFIVTRVNHLGGFYALGNKDGPEIVLAFYHELEKIC